MRAWLENESHVSLSLSLSLCYLLVPLFFLGIFPVFLSSPSKSSEVSTTLLLRVRWSEGLQPSFLIFLAALRLGERICYVCVLPLRSMRPNGSVDVQLHETIRPSLGWGRRNKGLQLVALGCCLRSSLQWLCCILVFPHNTLRLSSHVCANESVSSLTWGRCDDVLGRQFLLSLLHWSFIVIIRGLDVWPQAESAVRRAMTCRSPGGVSWPERSCHDLLL
mmetsp:Transcript_20901/g.32763  ORF Transcript_20901/g.32763 Transcript_20901/m.32763 type:complete len:220 (-) Transcript_20901:232-891(-)